MQLRSAQTRGLGKPETFDFLGFKHDCATRRDGSGFGLAGKPMAKRMRTKLREIAEQLMGDPPRRDRRARQMVCHIRRGWMAYYAVPLSGSAISAFRHLAIKHWHGALLCCSRQRRLTGTRMRTIR